jgi:hypothetical protein
MEVLMFATILDGKSDTQYIKEKFRPRFYHGSEIKELLIETIMRGHQGKYCLDSLFLQHIRPERRGTWLGGLGSERSFLTALLKHWLPASDAGTCCRFEALNFHLRDK